MLSSIPFLAVGLPPPPPAAAAAPAAPLPPSGCLRLLPLASASPVCSASLQQQREDSQPGRPGNPFDFAAPQRKLPACTRPPPPTKAPSYPTTTAPRTHQTDSRARAASSFARAAASSGVSFLLPSLPAPDSSKSSRLPSAVGGGMARGGAEARGVAAVRGMAWQARGREMQQHRVGSWVSGWVVVGKQGGPLAATEAVQRQCRAAKGHAGQARPGRRTCVGEAAAGDAHAVLRHVVDICVEVIQQRQQLPPATQPAHHLRGQAQQAQQEQRQGRQNPWPRPAKRCPPTGTHTLSHPCTPLPHPGLT